MSPRRIAHIDMDAFYASVELLRYPQLKGQPVVIGGRSTPAPLQEQDGTWRHALLAEYVGRGVVTTSTYEARQLGVFSAMGLMKAAQLAPRAVLLPADFTAYRYYSRLFKKAVASVSDNIEDRGIDEIYVDLSHLEHDSRQLAESIQQAVYSATGLTCSVGITPNKLLSKIASELHKPNGICVLGMADVPSRIWPLPVHKINGVGPKSYQKLQQLGILTIGDLAHAEPTVLQEHFGQRYALWLSQVAHGMDERPVTPYSEPKSLSRETTFERDLHVQRDKARLSATFVRLCAQLEDDLRRKGLCTQNVGIKLKFEDFQTVTRDSGLAEPIIHAAQIHRAAGLNLKRVRVDRRIRLLGVKAGALKALSELDRQGPEQLSLLCDP